MQRKTRWKRVQEDRQRYIGRYKVREGRDKQRRITTKRDVRNEKTEEEIERKRKKTRYRNKKKNIAGRRKGIRARVKEGWNLFVREKTFTRTYKSKKNKHKKNPSLRPLVGGVGLKSPAEGPEKFVNNKP